MGDSFVHLHTHTEFSMLDGASRVGEVVAAAASDAQPAIGITDHGNMYGVLDFYKAARERGIVPIIGTEAYMAAESRFERPVRSNVAGDKLYYHLTLLAESNAGYKNLLKLSSAAYLEGYCLPPGQEILTADGLKAVEEIEVGETVVTHRGRLRPVTQALRRPFSGTLYGIRLNNRYGRVTWMTGEHPVLIRNADGIVDWVRADQIEAGRKNTQQEMSSWRSFVCLPKVRPDRTIDAIDSRRFVSWTHDGSRFVKESMRSVRGPTRHYAHLKQDIALDYDFGFFLGLYAAEGAVSQRGEVEFSLNANDFDLIDHVRRVVKNLTAKEVRLDNRPDRPGYGGVGVRLCSVLLGELLVAMCGTGAANKRLPAFTFEAPEPFRRGVVEGVFAGDGGIRHDSIILTQASRTLAWQVRLLAAEFCNSFPSVSPHWDGHRRHAIQYTSNFTPPNLTGHRKVLFDDEYVYRPVAEILTREYEGEVFNFEVEDDHSYVSDFALHNCYKPRVDWELLERHREGVIATSGCLGGVVCQALLREEPEAATKLAGRLLDIFGPDNFFVELQDHGIADQHRTNPQLIDIARRIGAPLLATNDSHYTRQEDAAAHDALLCVQTGSSIDDPKRLRFEGDQHYLKTAAEMRRLFREAPESCDNTLAIAERAQVEIEFGKPELPRFPLPEDVPSEDAYLRQLTFEGAHRRYGDPLPTEVSERLERELTVICDMGFAAYFLVVWDLIRHARETKIRVGPGRGSSAGCCVAYCLHIVDLDPIANGLIFERFLNAGRREMPDIDMDFDERFRGEMIRYAAERYGSDHVAQVVTFSTIKARAAVRDAARVLGYPYGVGDRIAKVMPPLVMGRPTSLAECLEKVPGKEEGYKMAAELRTIYETDPDAHKVIEVARGLEDLRRQDGIHAAAVVITREPLTEYLPVQRKPEPGGDPQDAPIVTQYEMHGVSDLGLLKMDFLGLRNLTVIERTLDLVEESTGDRIPVDNLPLDDEKTFEMLRRGDSVGVFQLEGGPMRSLMRSLTPTCFDDVAALVALYRPGPMAANMHNDYADRKNGRKPVTCLHDDLAELLADTQGLMIYQEGLMRVAEKFAGYSLEEADNLRKATSKKIRSLMALEREKFVAGCESMGYGRDIGDRLFAIIEPFADYAFPKAHAYCYGMVAYQTAWLKANYPVEYLAALLTSVKDDKDKTAIYLAECRSMGIQVLVPDVNASSADFRARDGSIRFGMASVRNVGEGLVGHIVTEREQCGPFRDFYDFCERVDPMVLNKRSIESLIKSGAFDSVGHPRLGLLNAFERIIDRTLARRRERDLGVMNLFGDSVDGPSAVHDERVPIEDLEFDSTRRLAFEKEMLGLYVSSHPLLGVEGILRRHADCTIAELRELADGEMRWVGGVVTTLQRKYTRRGELMAVFTLEDLQSAIEVMVFPRSMQECGALLADDAVVCIKGRLDKGRTEEPPKIICMQVKRPDVSSDPCPPVRIKLAPHSLSESLLGRLKSLLRDHPGESPVFVHLDRAVQQAVELPGGTAADGERKGVVLRLPDEFRVDSRNGLFAELRVLLGPNGLVT